MKFEKIAFVATDMPEARAAREALGKRYGETPPEEADVIVALGGDEDLMDERLERGRRRVPRALGAHGGPVFPWLVVDDRPAS